MGEIKSTLDIVMEKTKHLSLSKEEKEAQQEAEARKALKGLIQKFKDQILKPEMFATDLSKIEEKYQMTDRSILVEEILEQIDFSQDNSQMLLLLKDTCQKDTSGLTSVLENFTNEINASKISRSEEFKRQLSEKHAISGSAVLPNPDADTEWLKLSDKIHNDYERKIAQEKSRIKNN